LESKLTESVHDFPTSGHAAPGCCFINQRRFDPGGVSVSKHLSFRADGSSPLATSRERQRRQEIVQAILR
jgi:hypothetical protein